METPGCQITVRRNDLQGKEENQVNLGDVAYLTDRVHVNQGMPSVLQGNLSAPCYPQA